MLGEFVALKVGQWHAKCMSRQRWISVLKGESAEAVLRRRLESQLWKRP